jgi:hypothetical protein
MKKNVFKCECGCESFHIVGNNFKNKIKSIIECCFCENQYIKRIFSSI